MVEVGFGFIEPLVELPDVEFCHLRDILVVNTVGERFLIEPSAVAFGTGLYAHELFCPFLRFLAVVALDGCLKVFHHSVEADKIVARCVYHLFLYPYLLELAVEYVVESVVGQFRHWGLEREPVVVEYGVYLPEYHLVLVFSEWQYGSLVYRERGVWDYLREVNLVHRAQSLASGACSFGGVEREFVRCRVVVGYS